MTLDGPDGYTKFGNADANRRNKTHNYRTAVGDL